VTVLLFELPAQPVVLRPFPLRRAGPRRALLAVKLAFIAWVGVYPAFDGYKYLTTEGSFGPRRPIHGFYRVESFSRNGVVDGANPDDVRWVRLGINQAGVAGVQHADGTATRFGLKMDETKKTFTIRRRDDPTKELTLAYAEPEPGVLRLEGPFGGAPTIVVLRKEKGKEGKSLLLTRGFHWINEYPFNR